MNLPNNISRCTQVDCWQKYQCLRWLSWQSAGFADRVVVTQFPAPPKGQPCQYRIEPKETNE